jgi:hypothetical protein
MGNIVTGKVRLSYVNVFKPKQDGVGAGKFSITLLIPKSDMATKALIDNAIAECRAASAPTFGGKIPPQLQMPIHDGDGLRQSGEPFGEECRGHWVMSASSLNQPGVVDAAVQPILNPSELYSGCYGRVSIRFYAYNKNGNRGIACGLGNVQKLADGEPLAAGMTTAESDFGAPAQTGYAQPAYQQAPTAPAYAPQQQQAFAPQVPNPGVAINPVTGMPYTNVAGGIAGIQ